MNLEQFKNWAIAAGSVGKATDGGYVGECVSLINQYLLKVYGIPAGAWGDAKDWATNPSVAQYFSRVDTPQAGDIGVMGANFGGGYGHIFIYLSPTTILEQNGRVPRRVSTGSAYSSPIAILRHNGEGGDVVINDTPNEFARWSKLFNEIRGRTPNHDEFVNFAVGKTWLHTIELLSDDPEADAVQHAQEVGQLAVKDNWQKQILDGLDALDKANKKIAELGQKPVEVPPTTIDQTTKDQIAETNSIVKQIWNKITSIFK